MAPTLETPVRNSPASIAARLAGFEAGAVALSETSAGARPFLVARVLEELGVPAIVVVPTPDIAESTFADLSYYLGPEAALALVRPRSESIGALDSPSERSARMTLLADLAAGKRLIAVVPVAALRQYIVPKREFAASNPARRQRG